MIDKVFWQAVADKWSKDDDGISIPEISIKGIDAIDPDANDMGEEFEDEINDILADLGLDDI